MAYGGIAPLCALPAFYFTVSDTPTHTPHQTKAGWVPWAATLLARSQLLEGAGGPYFGSARGYASSLIPAIKYSVIHIFGYV